MSENLLPNGSFELDLSQPVHANWREMRFNTNWGNLQNRLTLKATALGQAPEQAPESVSQPEALDGERVGEISLEQTATGAVGHMTSPVIKVRPAQVHTLSVYARSEEPSARLQLGIWTTPVDFTRSPNELSYSIPLTTGWQRHTFTTATQDLEDRLVVDLIATADRPCRVWVDCAQLQEGPEATDFQPLYPIEAKLEGRQRPPFLHLSDAPTQKLYLSTYNSAGVVVDYPLNLEIHEMLSDQIVFSHSIDEAVPVGLHERELDLELPLVGEFVARVLGRDGTPIGIDEYIFAIHPVLPEDHQGVLRVDRGVARSLPAERTWLPWHNTVNWYSDCRNNIIVTDGGVVHVMTSDDDSVLKTADGGKSWETVKVTRAMNTVLRNGNFLNFEQLSDAIEVHASADEGQTWELIGALRLAVEVPAGVNNSGTVDMPVADIQSGPITELRDGTLVWPIGHDGASITPNSFVHCYRSSDGGRTWSTGSPMTHGGEPKITELSDGRLIAVCRNNPTPPIDGHTLAFKNEKPWQLWNRIHGIKSMSSYVKRTTLVESEDGGRSWYKARPGSLLLDQIRGQVIELPDGRLVFTNTHRVPTLRGGERARLSEDGGSTWSTANYYLNWAKAYPGEASTCLLPPELGNGEPGMLLTVIGERSESNWGSEGPPTSAGFEHMPRLMAIRWRP